MKKTLTLATTLIVITAVLNVINLPIELRFTDAKYNYLFTSLLSFFLPLSIILTSFQYNKSYKYALLVGGILLCFPSFILSFITYNDFKTIYTEGFDSSFKKIHELNINDIHYRLYRTNGGATTSYGLILRKEKNILKGIKSVKVILSEYRASQGTLTLINNKTIEVKIDPYKDNEKAKVIQLKL